jgi:MFS family permease
MTDQQAGVPAPTENPHLGLALAVIASAQLMLVLDASIINVALPTIHRQLHFSEANLEWLVTAYALTFGGLLLFGGRRW